MYMLDALLLSPIQERNEIEKDLHRTFPNHSAFDAETDGRSMLRDVLTAYALRNCDVGYCQSLNYVAAMLLVALHFDAEAAFWILASVCEDYFPGLALRSAWPLTAAHVRVVR